MNDQTSEQWHELARIWKSGDAPVTAAVLEALHVRQHRRLRLARAAELGCSALGVVAALWLGMASRFLWVGILTVFSSIALLCLVVRARRMPPPQGAADLLASIKDSQEYLDWQAERLRYGRMLGFIALFAVVMAASIQLMHLAVTSRSAMLATAAASITITATLAWNMTLAWQAWRRAARLRNFSRNLVSEHEGPLS